MNELKRELEEQMKSFKRVIEEQKAATETLFDTLKISMERSLEDKFNEMKGYISNPSRNLKKIGVKEAPNGNSPKPFKAVLPNLFILFI